MTLPYIPRALPTTATNVIKTAMADSSLFSSLWTAFYGVVDTWSRSQGVVVENGSTQADGTTPSEATESEFSDHVIFIAPSYIASSPITLAESIAHELGHMALNWTDYPADTTRSSFLGALNPDQAIASG